MEKKVRGREVRCNLANLFLIQVPVAAHMEGHNAPFLHDIIIDNTGINFSPMHPKSLRKQSGNRGNNSRLGNWMEWATELAKVCIFTIAKNKGRPAVKVYELDCNLFRSCKA
jgi:hypothetical protein